MFKRLARSPVIPFVGGTLIWAYMSILSHTMRWRVEGIEHVRKIWDTPQGWIAATWHSRILMMPVIQIIFRPKWPKPPHPATLMVSPSRDGEFTNRAGTWLGLHIIRGSASGRKGKDKRGLAAAREAMEVMKKGGCIVITIDGPKGPPEVVGMGTIKLAQQMGVPIVIYGLSANAKRLNTWDRLLWPNPFARAAVVIPEPIPTSKDMDSRRAAPARRARAQGGDRPGGRTRRPCARRERPWRLHAARFGSDRTPQAPEAPASAAMEHGGS